MSMMKWTLPLVLIPLLSSADANMRDASFLKTEHDFKNPLLARTYNSRSLWQGTFGFGWCAPFEKSLEITSSSEGILKFCDKYKKVKIQSFPGEKHVLDEKRNRSIFDSSGKLIRIENRTRKATRLTYNTAGKLIWLQAGKETYQLSYDEKTGFLSEILESNKKETQYLIENQELKLVRNSRQAKTEYLYDSFHNLTEIHFSGKIEKIVYQTELDEIRAHFQSNGCYDLFQFKKINELEFKSLIHKRCPSSPPLTKLFSFTSKRTPQGGLVLNEVKTAGGKDDSSVLP